MQLRKISSALLSLGSLALVFISLVITLPINTSLNKRDAALLEIEPIAGYKVNLAARDYCQQSLGVNFGAIHCNTTNTSFVAKNDQKLNADINDELKNALIAYKDLNSKLTNSSQNQNYLIEISGSVIKKINKIQAAIELSEIQDSNLKYLNNFNSLLSAQGLTYSPYSNRFKTLPQNIANYAINQNEVKAQLKKLSFISNYLYLIAFAILIVAWFVTKDSISRRGVTYVAFYFLAIAIGLNIVRDASLHYGYEASNFELNPLRQLLERQSLIYLGSICIFLISMRYAKALGGLLEKTILKLPLLIFTLILTSLTVICYIFFGPAIGSETFKIVSCLIAAGLLTRYGRTIELAQEKFGLLSLLKFPIKNFFTKKNTANGAATSINLSDYFSNFITKKVAFHIFVVGILILIVSAIFSDLGGSLVAASLFVFSLFVLLGSRFALSLIAIFTGLCALIYVISEKVQGRVALMMEPMRANISDFARLIEFNEASQPYGYGLGSIQWCSTEGICLPLQSLSDYMPTLISGWMGRLGSSIFLILFAIILLRLSYLAFTNSWFYNDKYKFIKALSSLLCLAAFFQLMVTVLGNLRIIPLTGLGTPLISIGISSSITASLGMGLAIGLCFDKRK
jgi:cell division protein FtsW (lipid II flippase)